ncbi:MAG: acyl carrier protein [Bacteroidota bacterium]
MTQEQRHISSQLVEFLKSEIIGEGPEFDLQIDEDLLSSGLITSMDIFRLIEFLEKEYEIKVEPTDMTIDNFISVEAMEAFVSQKRA